MKDLCVECKKKPVYIKKRALCRSCYYKLYHKRRIDSPKWVMQHETEVEFVKNFFTHKNWMYHPAIFRLNGCNYEPDFYDGERNTFIEVSGTRQAFHANFNKYKSFVKAFPELKFEVRNSSGELKPLEKRSRDKKKQR